MHFLCLHGMGTNSQIFELQTAALRYEIGQEHTYDFVEGAVPYPMAPGIEAIAAPGTETFTYFSKDSAEQAINTLSELHEYIITEGPFDGIIGFSEGAAVAAMLMMESSSRLSAYYSPTPLFRVAIFLCGGVPACPKALIQKGERRLMSEEVDGTQLSIPTAHVWGANDTLWPDFGPVLAGLCEKSERWEFVHDGGHETPMKGSDLKKAAKVARNAAERACERQ